jgi:hypothetical protein
MSIRNGGSERVGNCFVLLCAHTFREGIDGKQIETKEYPNEKVCKLSETISGIWYGACVGGSKTLKT